MPVSSESYSFQSIKAELIIRKAYELINVPLSMVTSDQYDSAKNAINFILTDWFNQNVNLWTQSINFINLVPAQAKYILPSNIQKITECVLRSSARQNFGGMPFSSEGYAPNAFDDNPNNACTQTEADGFIGYQYPTPQIIKAFGVNSDAKEDSVWTLLLQGSNDNASWTDIIPTETLTYVQGDTKWFFTSNNTPYLYYQIKGEDGSVLNIRELYFNNGVVDTIMSEVSRYEYYSYANKFNVGRPTVYYVDYLKTLNIYIWQSPSPAYNLMFYSGQSLIQTLESYTESVDIPSIFYMPLVYGLAETLANQYAPEKADALKMRYNEYMDRAVINNTTEVPLTLGVYSD